MEAWSNAKFKMIKPQTVWEVKLLVFAPQSTVNDGNDHGDTGVIRLFRRSVCHRFIFEQLSELLARLLSLPSCWRLIHQTDLMSFYSGQRCMKTERKNGFPFLWILLSRRMRVSQFKSSEQVKMKRTQDGKHSQRLEGCLKVQRQFCSVCRLVKTSHREVSRGWVCSSDGFKARENVAFNRWGVSITSTPSQLKRFHFKWQEGDSEPLIGGSEVFSEVERNSWRLKIKPDNSELIADESFGHLYPCRCSLLHNLVICCLGSVFTVLSKQGVRQRSENKRRDKETACFSSQLLFLSNKSKELMKTGSTGSPFIQFIRFCCSERERDPRLDSDWRRWQTGCPH